MDDSLSTGPSEPAIRRTLARCRVTMLASTTAGVAANAMKKGDVLATARIAGIQAGRHATSLLPMSHPVQVGNVDVNFTIADTHIEIEAIVETADREGIEMEALTAAMVAALTIYDMCKSADRTMNIGEVALWEKSGGRADVWRREGIVADTVSERTEG